MDRCEDYPAPILDLDRASHAAMSRLTQGLSPSSFALAWMDWLLHLAIAPGKQFLLADKARRKVGRLLRASMMPASQAGPCIEPLPGDQRFRDPAWQQWPYNLIHQNFLLTQQWWHNATTGVRGVTRHHEDVVSFAARQWLDMWSPSNFLATNPEALQATLREGGMNLLRGALYAADDLMRAFNEDQAHEALPFVPGRDVALTPGKVVMRNDLVELIQYAPATVKVRPEPVLIVPSWIMKYYILDLSPRQSLVRYLVEQGHTVFILSWRNPGAADRDLGMDDYLRLGPMAALDAVSALLPRRRVHAVGYCLGGTLMAIAAAAMARDGDARLATLSLLAAQTDFEEPGDLGLFVDESQITYLEDMMWAQGFLDGRQMGGSFTFLNARDLLWSRMVREYLLGQRPPPFDLMSWNADVTRMPCRMHAEYLRSLYLNNELARGSYKVDGRPVALGDLSVPIFAVGTERDHVSPWRSVHKIHLLADAEVSFALTNGGHNAGILSEPGHEGRRYRLHTRAADGRYRDPDAWLQMAEQHEGSWWTAWQGWLASHSGPMVAPPARDASRRGYPVLGDAPGTYVAG